VELVSIPDITHLVIRVGSRMRWNTFAKPLTKEMSEAASTSLRWHRVLGRNWEKCGLAYDSTVVLPITSVSALALVCPIVHGHWKLNREIELLEIPLVAMDVTLAYYMASSSGAVGSIAIAMRGALQDRRGDFTLLWHNGACSIRIMEARTRPCWRR